MTAASHARGRRVAVQPVRPRLSWSMLGVLGAALSAVLGVAVAYGALTDRVAHIEQQLPPGAIQRLDERTLQIQHTLDELASRR